MQMLFFRTLLIINLKIDSHESGIRAIVILFAILSRRFPSLFIFYEFEHSRTFVKKGKF
jgi:hypothetical protein